MSRLKIPKKSTVCMALGLLLMAAALMLMLCNQWAEARARASAEEVLEEWQSKVEKPEHEASWQPTEYEAFPDREMPVLEINGQLYIGTLEIPALELTLPVMSQWSYTNLNIAPCRYQGTVYKDDLVIAAHNYWSHFGRLKNLLAGDEIIFTDADGNHYSYQVMEQETVEPMEIDRMCTGDWDLTLFTCTYGGQTRLALRCGRSGE